MIPLTTARPSPTASTFPTPLLPLLASLRLVVPVPSTASTQLAETSKPCLKPTPCQLFPSLLVTLSNQSLPPELLTLSKVMLTPPVSTPVMPLGQPLLQMPDTRRPRMIPLRRSRLLSRSLHLIKHQLLRSPRLKGTLPFLVRLFSNGAIIKATIVSVHRLHHRQLSCYPAGVVSPKILSCCQTNHEIAAVCRVMFAYKPISQSCTSRAGPEYTGRFNNT
ncbi:hypothetical protein LX36DRAFT_483765 [Colletotrichum falcatum]|nr:hypothetical protein LX36DRAFT_483765 [Colletotrichum falcatum]